MSKIISNIDERTRVAGSSMLEMQRFKLGEAAG
jgi:hypothetical protein